MPHPCHCHLQPPIPKKRRGVLGRMVKSLRRFRFRNWDASQKNVSELLMCLIYGCVLLMTMAEQLAEHLAVMVPFSCPYLMFSIVYLPQTCLSDLSTHWIHCYTTLRPPTHQTTLHASCFMSSCCQPASRKIHIPSRNRSGTVS